jgi:glycosyltransferase involved in cell wall biosynthesis
MKGIPVLSVVLPIHNQAGFIQAVVAEIDTYLRSAKVNFELILAENGSRDETLTILRRIAHNNPRAHVVVAHKRGFGGAIIDGWAHARGEFVCHMTSTGQIDPKDIVRCFKAVFSKKGDIVKIYRPIRESILRKIVSRTFNAVARILFGTRVKDINSCPKIFRRELLPLLNLKFRDSFIDLELIVKAHALDLSIVELPTTLRERTGGRSYTNFRTLFEFLRNMFRYRISDEFRQWKKTIHSQETT